MKAIIENAVGTRMYRDIDVSDTPMTILRKFYEEDATAAAQVFCDQKSIDQLMAGDVDETKSSFALINSDENIIRADWKTPLCNQPSIKEELACIESKGEVPSFVVTVCSFVANKPTMPQA